MTSKNATPGAYGILCLPNRKFYIGSSGNIERRIAEHRVQLTGNRHNQLPRLQRDWNEFGESEFEFARFPCHFRNWKRLEQQLIDSLHTLEHQQGYNKINDGKWGIEASIRNTESKYLRKGKFSYLPGFDPEAPMIQIYIVTFQRSHSD